MTPWQQAHARLLASLRVRAHEALTREARARRDRAVAILNGVPFAEEPDRPGRPWQPVTIAGQQFRSMKEAQRRLGKSRRGIRKLVEEGRARFG